MTKITALDKEQNMQKSVSECAVAAKSFFSRLSGLMFRSCFSGFDALILYPCSSIHTCFMRFPIDVLCLDSRGAVVDTAHNLRPWRFFFPRSRTSAIIELPSGTLARCGIGTGDFVRFGSSAQKGCDPHEKH